MSTTLRVDENIKQKLKIKSAELGISQYDLTNTYLLEGLKRDNRKKQSMTLEEIENLLDHDKPEGDDYLDNLTDIVETEFVTNSVELKKNSYK